MMRLNVLRVFVGDGDHLSKGRDGPKHDSQHLINTTNMNESHSDTLIALNNLFVELHLPAELSSLIHSESFHGLLPGET